MEEAGRKRKAGQRKRAAGGKKTANEERVAAQEERIRELEEKIRRLEEGKSGEVEPEVQVETGGTAASVLGELGGLIPGLDRLIQGLGKSEAFHERLRAIDEEIEARLRSEPLKRVEVGGTMSSLRSRPTGRPMGRRAAPVTRRAPVPEREEVVSKEPPVDVFDEETHLKVVAELPGIEEEDVEIDLNDARLVISANTPAHKYQKEMDLPYAPKGKVERLYRNGILELTLWKE